MSQHNTYKAWTKEDDLHLLQDHDAWANYPLLPVKRFLADQPLPECAVMAAGWPGHEHEVFLVGLYSIEGKIIDALKRAQSIKYTSYQAVMDDGWMVD